MPIRRTLYSSCLLCLLLASCSTINYGYNKAGNNLYRTDGGLISNADITATNHTGIQYTCIISLNNDKGIEKLYLDSTILAGPNKVTYFHGDSAMLKKIFSPQQMQYSIELFPGGDNHKQVFEINTDTSGKKEIDFSDFE